MGQYVALEEVPNIMRALGFYPTELQVQDMINEVKFSQYVDTGKTVRPSFFTIDMNLLYNILYLAFNISISWYAYWSVYVLSFKKCFERPVIICNAVSRKA